MKQIWSIIKVELSQLFYSPIAWLIIVLFTFQVYDLFSSTFTSLANDLDMYGAVENVTYTLYSDYRGIFKKICSKLYLYIPLLTMGLMSKDLSSGSVKLLYSSPLTSSQIVLGKYLSIILFSFIMMAITVPSIIFTGLKVDQTDFGLVFAGFIGIMLLFWAYAAVGLFMSSLTGYQIVAALLTFGTFTLLERISQIGQGISGLREFTQWTSMSGRTEQFLEGLISSEEVIYFLLIIVSFVLFTIYLLQYRKNNHSFSCTIKYLVTIVCVFILGYVSSRPSLVFYHDTTNTQANTLTENSRHLLEQIEGTLKITTYANLAEYSSWTAAPAGIYDDFKRYRKYFRFKPDIVMDNIYYWDEPFCNPDYGSDEAMDTETMARNFGKSFGIPAREVLSPDQIHERIDLSKEKNSVVKVLETEDGRRTFLRIFDDMETFPSEQEVSSALKCLVEPVLKVGFLTGHGERSVYNVGDGNYGNFTTAIKERSSLINTGFEVREASLEDTSSLMSNDILVISELKKSFKKEEADILRRYIDSGKNLLVAMEPDRISNYCPLFPELGLQVIAGTLVDASGKDSPTLLKSKVTKFAPELSHYFSPGMLVTMPTAVSLDYDMASEWEAVPILTSPDPDCWNEREVVDFDSIDEGNPLECNPKVGERQKCHYTALALMRNHEERQQRVIVLGDSDCFSNLEMSVHRKKCPAMNSRFFSGVFHWLSEGKNPVDVRRPGPMDNDIRLSVEEAGRSSIILRWFLPFLLATLGGCIVIRRSRR